MQTAIPYMLIRGGSSKGVFLNKKDLPKDEVLLEKVLIAIMEGVGSGDPRQIDGLGGADSLTAKIAIVNPSEKEEADLDYLFLQVMIGKGKTTTSQNCGNILAGVPIYGIASGMTKATNGMTTTKVNMLNKGGLCEVIIETPNGEISYEGDAKVDGVPNTGSPILCNYLGLAGSNCGALLPTDNPKDIVNDIEITCVDNGMPVVLLRATDFGITGYETKQELDANETLKSEIEAIRLKAGILMNLGDVSQKTVPKMCLISPVQNGGLVNTRTFIPHVCHAAIGVIGAVSTATGCVIKGSVAEGIVDIPKDINIPMQIEHPLGQFTVQLTTENIDNNINFTKSGVIRTARLISKGEVYIPSQIWDGQI